MGYLSLPASAAGIASSSATNYTSSVANAQTPMLINIRGALRDVAANLASSYLACVGDSQTFGYNSNITGSNSKTLSYPTQLAASLSVQGFPSHSNNFFGYSAGYISSNDPRVTVGAGWSGAGPSVPGGTAFTASSATSSLSFTPGVNVDTFEVFYCQNAGFGSLSVQFNSGTAQIVATAGVGNLIKYTITGALGLNTVNLNWSSGGAVNIAGVNAFDSSKKWMHILNMGSVGSKTSDWLVGLNQYSPYFAFNHITPLCGAITMLGTNDAINGVSLSTFTTNVGLMTTNFQTNAGCDVIWMTPPPNSSIPAATFATYGAGILAQGVTNSNLVIDFMNRMENNWTKYNAKGWYGPSQDSVHPDYRGYGDLAEQITNLVTI